MRSTTESLLRPAHCPSAEPCPSCARASFLATAVQASCLPIETQQRASAASRFPSRSAGTSSAVPVKCRAECQRVQCRSGADFVGAPAAAAAKPADDAQGASLVAGDVDCEAAFADGEDWRRCLHAPLILATCAHVNENVWFILRRSAPAPRSNSTSDAAAQFAALNNSLMQTTGMVISLRLDAPLARRCIAHRSQTWPVPGRAVAVIRRHPAPSEV